MRTKIFNNQRWNLNTTQKGEIRTNAVTKMHTKTTDKKEKNFSYLWIAERWHLKQYKSVSKMNWKNEKKNFFLREKGNNTVDVDCKKEQKGKIDLLLSWNKRKVITHFQSSITRLNNVNSYTHTYIVLSINVINVCLTFM